MKRGLRMSKKAFQEIVERKPGFFAAQNGNSTPKQAKVRQASEIIRAVSTATGNVTSSRRGLELRFDGARLATLNDLLAMSVQERRRYRKAWHKLIHDTALVEYGCRPPGFEAVNLTLVRRGPREIDPDAIIPKAPIDGLRYSGFIPDDSKAVVCSLSLRQALGSYAVWISVSPRAKGAA
jgi:hypothetical protein